MPSQEKREKIIEEFRSMLKQHAEAKARCEYNLEYSSLSGVEGETHGMLAGILFTTRITDPPLYGMLLDIQKGLT